MRATITSKGQVTIPAKIRKKLDLKPGDVLEFKAEEPSLTATRVFEAEAMYSTIGCCKKAMKGRTGAQIIEYLRGPVESPEDDADGG